MQRDPPPFVWAAPDEKNILTCEYTPPSYHLRSLTVPFDRELHHCTSGIISGSASADIPQRGPPDSPYAGGEYHGVLLFPSEYPFKPPGIKVRAPPRVVIHALLTTSIRCLRLRVGSNRTRRYAFRCLTSIPAR